MPLQNTETKTLRFLSSNEGAPKKLPPDFNKIPLITQEGFELKDIREIIYCKAESNYTRFVLDNGQSLMVSKTLKIVAGALEPLGFFRVHQSYLVNLRHVTKYINQDGGFVVMSDGMNIQISRSRKKAFLQLVEDFYE